MILLLDGTGSDVARDLHVLDGNELMFLPAYSPELQPAEHLWPLIDNALANTRFKTVNDLGKVLAERCRILADDPDQVRANTLFCGRPKHI